MKSCELPRGATRKTLAAFLILFLTSCGSLEEEAQAPVYDKAGVADSVQESDAEERPSPQPADHRIAEGGQLRTPTPIAQMGYNFGSPDAPVKVLEISDFGCGFCRRFHLETFPRLLSIYMDGGYVEWKFIPFVLGRFPNALEAAIAAECAGEQDKFVPLQGRLFRDQAGWRNTDDANAYFSALAAEEGLDVERFDNCIAGGWRENDVRENIRLGQQVGTQGTPMFLVDGRPIPGALPLVDFRTILDASLVRRGVTPPPRR